MMQKGAFKNNIARALGWLEIECCSHDTYQETHRYISDIKLSKFFCTSSEMK